MKVSAGAIVRLTQRVDVEPVLDLGHDALGVAVRRRGAAQQGASARRSSSAARNSRPGCRLCSPGKDQVGADVAAWRTGAP